MKNKKRILVLTLTAVMVMSITACGKKNESGKKNVGLTTEEARVDDEGFTHSITLDEDGEINVFAFSEGQNYQKVIDKFEEVTKDTLKTKVNFQFATSIGEEAPLKLAAKEDIDLIFDAAWVNSQKNIKDGMYMDLSEYFNNPDYPGLQKAFPEDVVESMKSEDGKIYGIPYYNNCNTLPCIYIRGDWREKYGLPEVTDEETLYEYVKTIEEHKDELGVTSAVGLSNRGWFYFGEQKQNLAENGIFEVPGTGARVTQNMYAQLSDDLKTVEDARMIGEEDAAFVDWKIQSNFISEKAVEFGTKWYPYVNKDAISLDDAKPGFVSGLYGAVESELTAYSGYVQELLAYNPDAKLEYYIYYDNLRNKEEAYMDSALSSNYMYVPYYCDNPDRAMAVVDWIFESQSNNDLWTLGIEGEDWEAVGDNQYKDLQPDNKYTFPTFLWSLNPQYTRINADLPDDVKEYYAYSAETENFIKHPFAGFSFDNTKVQLEYTGLTTLQEDYYHQFMIGEFGGDTEAKLEEFNSKAKDYEDAVREEVISQLQVYIDKINAE